MAQTYTIESVGQKVQWEADANKGDYPAVFEGHTQEVLLFHDASSNYDPPKVGDEVFGDVVKQRGKFRLKRASKKDAGGGRSGGGGQRDDATGLSIERQTAAKAAAEMAAAAGGNAPAMIANFEGMFDIVIAKIHGVAPKPAQEVPADTDGLGAQQPVLDDVPFS